MALTKEKKQKIVDDLKEKVAKAKAIIFVDFTGLKVKELSELRKKLKLTDGEIKVVKKTLAGRVLRENKLEFEKEKTKGEIALVFGYQDEISPAKTVYQFSSGNENLKILGGFLQNEFNEDEKIIALAKLPTRDELLANLVRAISAPISGFVNVIQGNTKGLILALNAISKIK